MQEFKAISLKMCFLSWVCTETYSVIKEKVEFTDTALSLIHSA